MSTEVRWRRGTAAQHENFIGAMSEITHDTTNHNLRIHDGMTDGGHATLMEGQLGVPFGVTPLDETGNVPATHLGNVVRQDKYDFESKATVEAATIPQNINFLRISGYYTAGDRGGALYKRVVSQPVHAGKIQSQDGAWWEIAERTPDVRMFGAKGDGVSNDTATIQAAIDYFSNVGDAANTRGAVLTFSTGKYNINTALNIKKSINLVGIGEAGIYGNLASAINKYGLYIGDPTYIADTALGYHRVVIENIDLSGLVGHQISIFNQGVRTCTISRCTVSGGTKSSIEMIDAWSTSKVVDCWFQGGGNTGLALRGGCNGFEVRGNRIAGYKWDGATGLSLYIEASLGVWVHNNDFEYSHRHIYALSRATAACNSLTIENNWIEGAIDGSVFLDNAEGGFRGFTIKGNSIWGDPNGDVYLGNSGAAGEFIGGVIQGNTFNSPTFLNRRSDSTKYKAISQTGNYPESVNP